MELPEDVLCLIREFSKPVSRATWRQGSYANQSIIQFDNQIFLKSHFWKERNLLLHEYIRYLLDICDDFTI